ncbi:MAG: glycosyltransferase family 2 protein [Candidatus Zixiibacteriota bacterium]
MDNKPSISAVVIAYHGMQFIPDCLATLKEDIKDFPHEIIVVDNASTDGTVEFIQENHPDIRLITNDTNTGFAPAVNQGIKACRFDYIWLLNQDIRIRPGCLAALLQCHARLDRPGIIGPRLVGFDGQLQKFCRRLPRIHHMVYKVFGLPLLFPKSRVFNGWKMGDFDHLSSRPVLQPMGAAMLLHRSCIDDIGLMDESFVIFMNDVDYCERLIEAGYTNYYCYDAVIEHYQGGSTKRHKPKMIWLSHMGLYAYFRKVENKRPSKIIKFLRRPLLWVSGLALVLYATPRSLYHYLRKFI